MQERSIQILFGLCQHGFGPQWFRGRATRARVEGWLSIKRVPSETRELSRSPLMMTNRAFQPEAVEALAAAFQKAWRFMSHDQHFAVVDQALLKRRLAACLMEVSADGDRDPLRLANSAVRRMRQESDQTLPVLDGAAVFRRRRARVVST